MANEDWHNTSGNMPPKRFNCGYCGDAVASRTGYHTADFKRALWLCPGCNAPNFFDGRGLAANQHTQITAARYGENVKNVPSPVSDIFDQARDCMRVGAFTGAVLLLRNLLAHVAVQQGADGNRSFQH